MKENFQEWKTTSKSIHAELPETVLEMPTSSLSDRKWKDRLKPGFLEIWSCWFWHLLLAASIFFKILQHITLLTQLSLAHLKCHNKALWPLPAGVISSLTTTADKAASSSCCNPSSSSKLTWIHGMGANLYLSFAQITSVSPLLSTPVYRGHSGASISLSSKGQSFSSTDSLLPLTYSGVTRCSIGDKILGTLPCQAFRLPFL